MLSFQRKTEEEHVCIFGLSGLRGPCTAMNHFVWDPEILSLLCRGEGSAFACLKHFLESKRKSAFVQGEQVIHLKIISCHVVDIARVSFPIIKVTVRHITYNVMKKQFSTWYQTRLKMGMASFTIIYIRDNTLDSNNEVLGIFSLFSNKAEISMC